MTDLHRSRSRAPRLSRRNLLRGGAIAAAFGSLPWLRARVASGQPGPVPKRLFIVFGSTGGIDGYWEPTGSRSSLSLGPLMTPLEPYKNDMVVFRNLDGVSHHLDPTGAANGHHSLGHTHVLTGGNRLPSDPMVSSSPSLDQLLGVELNRAEPLTRLPSFVLSAGSRIPSTKPHIIARTAASWTGAGGGVVGQADPRKVFDQLFPEDNMMGEGSAELVRRGHILNLIRSEHTELVRRLSAPEAEKIEQHLQSRLDLERRLGVSSDRQTNGTRWEDIGSAYDPDTWRGPSSTAINRARYEQSVGLNLPIAAAALHADVSRVGMIRIGAPEPSIYDYSDGDFGTPTAHEFEHVGNNTWKRMPDSFRTQLGILSTRYRLRYEAVRGFVDDLASRIETDGQRLLDHSIVLCVSQIAHGGHQLDDLPWCTIGSCGGAIRTGQFLEFQRRTHPTATDRRGRPMELGRPHSDLLLTIAQAMGVPLDSIGNEASTGPIAEMLS
ncbi:MAG: DUF1552 domain-containing protein [Myxococcota bacterium]